nr:zinc finger, CCHC-type, retrotransposon Gag domain protein [Tanacetum cinerariifolium]
MTNFKTLCLLNYALMIRHDYDITSSLRRGALQLWYSEPGYETVGSKDLTCEDWIREEFRTSSGPSDAGGNPPPVTIHTWLERFNKQKPHSFEKATAPVDAENWISYMEKIFNVMGCKDAFKTRLAVYNFKGNALAWWKAYKRTKGGDAWLITMVNTRTDADLSAAVQNALQTLLPQIHAEIREEFRTSSGPSDAGGNPPLISHMEKIFDVMGYEDAFKTRLAVYKFEGNALAWWKAYKQAKGGDAWLERLKREYHSIRQTNTETSTEFMQRFLRLAGFLGVANAARNYEILHERDDDTERPDKRQKSGDRHQPTSQQSSHRSHGHNNDRHGSDRRGGSDNHRSSNNNYSGSNNRNSGYERD